MLMTVCITAGVAAAWCGHTLESKAYADDFDAALADCGLTRKDASGRMGLDADGNDLSKMLAGLKPLNVYRVLVIGPAFNLALMKRQAGRSGAVVITQQEREFILGVAQLGLRRLTKVLPSIFPERRSA